MNIIRNITYYFRSNKFDQGYSIKDVKGIQDDIIIKTIDKWKLELSKFKPNKFVLIAYVDDIHSRMMDLGIDDDTTQKFYDDMYKQINKL
jgi:hypothetical protein